MRNIGVCVALFVVVVYAGLLSSGLSWPLSDFVIRNNGTIAFGKVTAQSGSSTDIQAAVNTVNAVGGGEVIIPAGNFTFKVDYQYGISNGHVGVKIPGGVNITGAGNNQTVLHVPTGLNISSRGVMFECDGSNSKPIRISGIMFQGGVYMAPGINDVDNQLDAINLWGVKDYRVDHCTFIDFSGTAIYASANYVHKWNLGVIDHNIIDNPYKDTFYMITGNQPLWAYGIIVGGDSQWDINVNDCLGQYKNNTCFIEDNSVRRCRHAIAMSAEGGWAVVRHNNFTEMIVSFYGSYVDAHGGARGYEVYNNTITNSPTDYRSVGNATQYYGQYMGAGIAPRGGAGVIYNNTLLNFIATPAIVLTNDQSNPTYRLHYFWIWDNTFINVQTQLGLTPNAFSIVEGTDYFQYAKPDYVAYPYPHPLTLG